MTQANEPTPRNPSPEVRGLLRAAGLSDDAVNATMVIDGVLQTWRRQMQKREIGGAALRDLDIGLDLAQLDVLAAIDAPENEFSDHGEEPMVATIAARLAIDPSRASRLVSELVETGYVARAASQADARRTIVELTALGRTVLEAVRAYKWLIMGQFLSEWSAAERDLFIPLLHRFSQWSEEFGARVPGFASEIDALRAAIDKADGGASRREAG